MTAIKIPCPECQAVLKLPDRSLLGKTGKCPKCQHRFVLTEPAAAEPEVPIEVVDPAAPPAGLNPTWIPDTPAASSELPFSLTGAPQKPAENPLDFLKEELAIPTADGKELHFIHETPEPDASGNSAAESEPDLSQFAASSSGKRRIKKHRRRSGNWKLIVGFLVLAGAAGGLIYHQSQNGGKPLLEVTSPAPVPGTAPMHVNGGNPAPAHREVAEFNPIQEQSPTKGQPIQLLHMPAGVRIAINLHPAQIWGESPKEAEFRASLGPLGTWLESQIVNLTRQQPGQIEELLVGILLGPRGVAPELAMVVTLKEAPPRAELLTTYAGKPYEEFNTNIQLIDGVAYQLVDDRTISICPEKYLEDLLAYKDAPAITAGEVEEILKSTDRDRMVTVAFIPEDLDMHRDMLFPADAQTSIEKGLRWLGPEATAVAWSMHLGDEFFTEMSVLGEKTSKPFVMKSEYQNRLGALPELMLATVQKMDPPRSGYRKIIGRFPAMLKVLAMTTTVAVDHNLVRFATSMPSKAGPNLALGTLLTWDESTRTNFDAVVAVAPPPKPEKQLSFQEKLQKKMNVDFRRTPLQEAFAFIAEDSKIPIEIDGDALKMAGFTKNMPQTYQQDGITTLGAIYNILKNYENEGDPIVVHVSEKDNKITVLTKKAATNQGLEIYDLSKFKEQN
ncbi:MAG: hypothetical protein KDA78_16470 [Planctomycetaceae bacterium]|nr:hypothetical protein [Planctomycetaceae bacterium]